METDKFWEHFKRFMDIMKATVGAETIDAENAEKKVLGKISPRKYAKKQKFYVAVNLKAQEHLEELAADIKSCEQSYLKTAYDTLQKIIFLEKEALKLCIAGIEKDDPSYIYRSTDRRNEASDLVVTITEEVNKAKVLEKEKEKTK